MNGSGVKRGQFPARAWPATVLLRTVGSVVVGTKQYRGGKGIENLEPRDLEADVRISKILDKVTSPESIYRVALESPTGPPLASAGGNGWTSGYTGSF